MKQQLLIVKDNIRIANDVYMMTLDGADTSGGVPGQFINIKLDGFYLRRPISVNDMDENSYRIIYKVVGKGTAAMSELEPGVKLDTLTGLGNGFDVSLSGDKPLLIGGGVGVPPLYYLAKKLVEQGKTVTAVLGFNSKGDVICKNDLEALGVKVYTSTVDGSEGIKGFVTDAMKELGEYSYFYTCGPEPMLKAVYNATVTEGELSFEARMGCGFGACMGCTCKTKYGNKRICKDGPVLKKEEVIW